VLQPDLGRARCCPILERAELRASNASAFREGPSSSLSGFTVAFAVGGS
jgi:hypothetical protein